MAQYRTSQITHNNGSSTCVIEPRTIELQPYQEPPPTYQSPNKSQASISSLNIETFRPSQDNSTAHDNVPPGELPSPTTATAEKKEQWNHPRINVYRTLSAFWCFILMGANDAASGVSIPPLIPNLLKPRLENNFLKSRYIRESPVINRLIGTYPLLREILRLNIHSRLITIPKPLSRLHRLCPPQQHSPPPLRPTRHRHYRTIMPTPCLHRDRMPPSLSGPCRHLHGGRYG